MDCTLKLEPLGIKIFDSKRVAEQLGHLELAIGFLRLFCRKFNCSRNPLAFFMIFIKTGLSFAFQSLGVFFQPVLMQVPLNLRIGSLRTIMCADGFVFLEDA